MFDHTLNGKESFNGKRNNDKIDNLKISPF